MRMMKPNSVAIFHSNDLMPRNGDTCFPFRQNSDLFYLSGLDQEETILLLFPDCPKKAFREVAFIRKTDERTARWEGQKYSKEAARTASGIEKVYWVPDFETIFGELALIADTIYTNDNEQERFRTEIPSKDRRFTLDIRQRYPSHTLSRAQPILKQLAMIKSEFEVEAIQQAIDITGKAFEKVLHLVRPGVMEYEVEAEITAEFLRNRANGHAYYPIIASGSNSCVLHYNYNNQACREGDVLLLDFGAEYANYAADITRCIPVSGQFSARQRAVYNSVLQVLREASKLLSPGITLSEYHKEVGLMMQAELLELGLLDRHDIEKEGSTPAYKRYFMHGTSHHLGLDVHDRAIRSTPLTAGMVFTCEPGIYIPGEGFGIRLENDLLITDEGPVDLSKQIPIEADAIEELMQLQCVKGVSNKGF